MSDTPLTDAEMCDGWSGDAFAVSVEFARKLEKQLAERDAALARCVEAARHAMNFIRQHHWNDNAPSRGNWDLDAAGESYKELNAATATISAQATAKVLAAARNLSLLLEQRNKMEDADDFGEPLGEVYQGVVDAEIALREAIREEQEGK